MRLLFFTIYTVFTALLFALPTSSLALKILRNHITSVTEDALVSRQPQPPATIRGVTLAATRNGYMRIWMVIDVVGTTFQELFQNEGNGRALAQTIGQHFIEDIQTSSVLDRTDANLVFEAPTVINIIYDAAEAGTYTGSIAVDIDATANRYGENFYFGIWVPFIRAATNYFTQVEGVDVLASIVDNIEQLGGDIQQIPTRSLHQRSLLEQQVCAKPVDLRPAIRARIPNWNLQQPHKTHC